MVKRDKYASRDGFPRFYKASYELQQRVGTGTVEQARIEKAQEYLDTVQIDVVPLIREKLALLEDRIATAREVAYEREEFLTGLLRPLMDVKSLSGMFHWPVVSRISAFVLSFMEDVRRLDDDVLEIITMHNRVIRLLMDRNTPDDDDPHGQAFLTELRAATKRYYDRHSGR